MVTLGASRPSWGLQGMRRTGSGYGRGGEGEAPLRAPAATMEELGPLVGGILELRLPEVLPP